MTNKYFLLITFFFLSEAAVCQSKHIKSFENHPHETYPYLADILDAYYSFHLSAPKDITAIASFAKEIYGIYPQEFYYYKIFKENTLSRLSKNKQKLKIEQTHCGFNIFMDNTLIYENQESVCCDDVKEYREEEQHSIIQKKSNKVYFFQNNGKPVYYTAELIIDFLQCKKQIDAPYIFESREIITLKYNKKKGLCCFCASQQKPEIGHPYFQNLEKFLYEFCKRHHLAEIVFHTKLVITEIFE